MNNDVVTDVKMTVFWVLHLVVWFTDVSEVLAASIRDI
jgi:hypothetical protein